MKTIILAISLLLIGKLSFAQNSDLGLPPVYADTVSVTAAKAELYARAKEYLAKNTTVKKDIIQMDDPALGRLVSNSTSIEHDQFSDMLGYSYVIKYTTSIAVKDGKYKYIINDLTYNEKQVTLIRASAMLKKVIAELRAAMAKKSNLDF